MAGLWGRRSDRKSTRLNSSHLGISYAVFCLKKKSPRLGPRRAAGLPSPRPPLSSCAGLARPGAGGIGHSDVWNGDRPQPIARLFFFNDTATTEIYTLSLHDALPICNNIRDLKETKTMTGYVGPIEK